MHMLVTNQTAQDYWFGPLHLAAGDGQTLTVDDTTATSLYLTNDAVADAINALYASGKIGVTLQAQPFPRPTGTPQLLHGDGDPEGLVFAGQGSIYLRRDTAYIYTKSTGIHLCTGWRVFGASGSITEGLFSAGPPANPSDGDIWRALACDTGNLFTTAGIVWSFRYNASSGSSYKWEFIGGPAAVSEVSTGESSTSTSYAALATAGPSLTLSRGGDYDVRVEFAGNPNSPGTAAYMSYDIGATGASDNDAAYISEAGGLGGNVASSVGHSRRKSSLAASITLTAKYRT